MAMTACSGDVCPGNVVSGARLCHLGKPRATTGWALLGLLPPVRAGESRAGLKARAGQDGDRIEALDNVALVSCGFGKLDLTV